MKILSLLILILLITPSVSATIIQGKVYDIELNRLNNVVIEIDTIPQQRVISQGGEYFFNAPIGDYTITARAIIDDIIYSTNEDISIIDDGEYIIDLFLFPELENIKDINVDVDNKKDRNLFIYLILSIGVILVTFILFKKIKNRKITNQEIDEDLNNIYNIIKKEKRITQKELRKDSILSEAKISLIITQLEKENKIQKIKKGRINIIILK